MDKNLKSELLDFFQNYKETIDMTLEEELEVNHLVKELEKEVE